MRVVVVPMLEDNFGYLVIDGTDAVIVDPSEHTAVCSALARDGLHPRAIWLTHHHRDHVGGVEGLLEDFPGIEVVAHASEASRIPRLTRGLSDGDHLALGALRGTVLHTPGHTLGALTYVIAGAAFTGDTLFGAGCGRVFEGTMEMMHASLRRLASLPPATRVYFGHEYTAANLAFAAEVEPGNRDIDARARATATPSAPSTIELELATNPFLRAADLGEFAARRAAKDGWVRPAAR
jgi:hydroxyacylglutathione hydrolase